MKNLKSSRTLFWIWNKDLVPLCAKLLKTAVAANQHLK